MKRTILALAVSLLSTTVLADDRQTIEKSRQLSQALQQQLGAELMAAMKAQGPVHAIQVCNEKAPQIAQSLSTESVIVARTALRVRNPKNAPTGEQKAVMKYFAERLAKEPSQVPEVLYTTSNGEQQYMRAIVMQPQCAECHGSAVNPEVKQAVLENYPNDAATGFEVGDLRGSFVVTWLE